MKQSWVVGKKSKILPEKFCASSRLSEEDLKGTDINIQILLKGCGIISIISGFLDSHLGKSSLSKFYHFNFRRKQAI